MKKDHEVQAAIIVAKFKTWQAAESAAGKAAEHANKLEVAQDLAIVNGEEPSAINRIEMRNAHSHLATCCQREVAALREVREIVAHAPATLAAADLLIQAEIFRAKPVEPGQPPRDYHALEYHATQYRLALEEKIDPHTAGVICRACWRAFDLALAMPQQATSGQWVTVDCPHCKVRMEILWSGETLTRAVPA